MSSIRFCSSDAIFFLKINTFNRIIYEYLSPQNKILKCALKHKQITSSLNVALVSLPLT